MLSKFDPKVCIKVAFVSLRKSILAWCVDICMSFVFYTKGIQIQNFTIAYEWFCGVCLDQSPEDNTCSSPFVRQDVEDGPWMSRSQVARAETFDWLISLHAQHHKSPGKLRHPSATSQDDASSRSRNPQSDRQPAEIKGPPASAMVLPGLRETVP